MNASAARTAVSSDRVPVLAWQLSQGRGGCGRRFAALRRIETRRLVMFTGGERSARPHPHNDNEEELRQHATYSD